MLHANNALSPDHTDLQLMQNRDRDEVDIGTSCQRLASESAFGEADTRDYRSEKQQRRTVRDHNHTNPEFVWGDEGPVNERRHTS